MIIHILKGIQIDLGDESMAFRHKCGFKVVKENERQVDVMDDIIRAKVIHGEHKGKIGIVTGIFWAANTAIIKTDGGEEISVKPIEIAVNEQINVAF